MFITQDAYSPSHHYDHERLIVTGPPATLSDIVSFHAHFPDDDIDILHHVRSSKDDWQQEVP